MNKNIFATFLMISLSGFALSAKADSPSYSFTDLGTLGGIASYANAINSSGQVVGYSWTADRTVRATLWNGTTAVDLGALGGEFSEAYDINDAGQAVGYVIGVNGQRGVMWDGTTVTYLGADLTYATSINNSGQIVGVGSVFVAGNGFNTQDAYYNQAKLLNGDTATNLGTLGGLTSAPSSINNQGQVAGYDEVNVGELSNSRHATLWNGTTITKLGDSPNFSTAVAINDLGQVAGYSLFAGSGSWGLRATVWSENNIIDLGTLGGNYSYAFGINSLGQVVGSANSIDSNVLRATLWNDVTAIDLNSFLDINTSSAWLLTEAKDINDSGWIVGNAVNMTTGNTHAFLLTPVPEPENYLMMVVGISLVVGVSRRKKA